MTIADFGSRIADLSVELSNLSHRKAEGKGATNDYKLLMFIPQFAMRNPQCLTLV